VRRVCVPPPPWRFGAFGRSFIVPPTRVERPELVYIGDDVVVHEHTWLAIFPQFPDIVPRLVIGDSARVGRCCQFSVAAELVIEPNAIVGDFVQIGDTFHPWDVEDRMPVLVTPSAVRVGRGAIIGSHAVVLPGVNIGDGSYVEHHAVVQHDVAPGSRVAGRPARPVGDHEPAP
jgi:acetyltransferase-like isoleucine patch superfamily enzyme